MVSSNIELQRATETQVKALVEQLQTLGSELKNVSHGIKTLTDVMIEVKNALLESTLVSKTAIAKAEAEKRKRKEMLKPELYVQVEVAGFQLWIFGRRYYNLIIFNSGCDAIGMIVRTRGLDYGPYNIGTRTRIGIDIGHVNEFIGVSSLSVFLQVRDIERNLYQATIQVSLPQQQWISVPLTEQ